MNERGEVDTGGGDDGGDGNTGTPLPEAFAQDQELASFKTVEDLVGGYKETFKKASTIGSIEQIPEEIRNDPNIKKYKDIGELAKGHIETVKLVGRKGVLVPTEQSSKEEVDKFYNSIGRPEKPEGYKLTKLEKLHPSIKTTPESEKAFFDVAHSIGLTQSQADGLNKWYMETISGGLAKQDEASSEYRKQVETQLRQEWGSEFENNLGMTKRLVVKFGGEKALDEFGDLGNNPAVLKVLHNMAKKMSEDSINHSGFSDLMQTPDTAKAQIKELNKRIINMNQNDPEYGDLIKKKDMLYKIAYPE